MTVDVAVRLGLRGGAEVTRSFDQLGRKGAGSLREIRAAASGLPPHLVAVSRGVAGVRDQVDNLAARTGTLGSMASAFGPIGLGAAAAGALIAGASVMIYQRTRDAARQMDDLADAAERAGTSAEGLQAIRFAAQEVGLEAQAADTGLQRLNETLGRLKAGGRQAARLAPLAEGLGITREDIQNARDAYEFLPLLAERIKALGDQALQARVAQAFGIPELLPLLQQGEDGVNGLIARAREMGLVLDNDLIQRGADAGRQLEILDDVVRNQLALAFLPLAEQAAGATDTIGSLVAQVADWIRSVQALGAGLGAAFSWAGDLSSFAGGLWRATPLAQGGAALSNLGRANLAVQQREANERRGLDVASQEDLERQAQARGGGAGGPASPQNAAVARLLAALEAPARGGRGRGRGRGGGADQAQRQADAREQLADRQALDEARARGDQDAIRSLERQSALHDRIRAYRQAGVAATAAQANAERDMAALDAARAEAQQRAAEDLQRQADIELAQLDGDLQRVRTLQSQEELQRRITELQERGGRDAVEATLEAARTQEQLDAARERSFARAREDMALAVALEVAQTTGNDREAEALQRQQDLRGRIEEYKRNGLDLTKAQAAAEEDLLRIEEARALAARRWLAEQAEAHARTLADLRGDGREVDRLDRERRLRDRIAELQRDGRRSPDEAQAQAHRELAEEDRARLQGQFRSAFRDGVHAAADGDLGELLSSWVQDWFGRAFDRSLDRLSDRMQTIAEQFAARLFEGRSGGNDIWGALAQAIGLSVGGGHSVVGGAGPAGGHPFGGGASGFTQGRAIGGPVYRGQRFWAGEQGAEPITAASDAFVHHAQSMAATADGGSSGGDRWTGERPIEIKMENRSGYELRATATERRDGNGGRELMVQLERQFEARIDQRIREMTEGGRDDAALSHRFGVRPRLSGG